MIRIICLGKIKEKYLNDLINDYKTRIEKYHKIEIVELKEGLNLEEEAEDILRHIASKDYTIACAIEGKHIDSVSFAKTIDKAFLNSGTINFIIGSSFGLAPKIKEFANECISFSDMTMPHGFFRGVLLEQIYRAFKINKNESYHK